jgi:hypothetical protein
MRVEHILIHVSTTTPLLCSWCWLFNWELKGKRPIGRRSTETVPKNSGPSQCFIKRVSYAHFGNCEKWRLIWQRDLSIEEDVWKYVVSNVEWCTRDTSGKCTHYKIIHRYYWTPVRLLKMGLLQNNDMLEMQGWSRYLSACYYFPWCSLFWKGVLKKLEEWVGQPIPESPQLCWLGDISILPPGISKEEFGLDSVGFLTAAWLIPRNWKSADGPESTDWLKLMVETSPYESMIAKLQKRKGSFFELWETLFELYEGVDVRVRN